MIPYAPAESVTAVVVDAIGIRAGLVANFLYDTRCCSANKSDLKRTFYGALISWIWIYGNRESIFRRGFKHGVYPLC